MVIIQDVKEREQRELKLARGGETSHLKEYTPSREDCKAVSHPKLID